MNSGANKQNQRERKKYRKIKMGQTFGSTHMSNRHLWTRKDYGKSNSFESMINITTTLTLRGKTNKEKKNVSEINYARRTRHVASPTVAGGMRGQQMCSMANRSSIRIENRLSAQAQAAIKFEWSISIFIVRRIDSASHRCRRWQTQFQRLISFSGIFIVHSRQLIHNTAPTAHNIKWFLSINS